MNRTQSPKARFLLLAATISMSLISYQANAQQVSVPHAKAKKETIHELVLEIPGITCKGRFEDSLKKNFVKKLTWVKSLKTTYIANPKKSSQTNHLMGETATVVFTVEKEEQRPLLLKKMVDSKLYFGTEDWKVIEKKSVLKFLNQPKKEFALPLKC